MNDATRQAFLDLANKMTREAPRPGDLISRPGLKKHSGIFIGELPDFLSSEPTLGPRVVHNMPDTGVQVVSLAEFSNGQRVTVERRAPDHARSVIVQRALASVGRPYNVGLYNCEHLATHAFDGQPRSPQVEEGAVSAVKLAIEFIRLLDQ